MSVEPEQESWWLVGSVQVPAIFGKLPLSESEQTPGTWNVKLPDTVSAPSIEVPVPGAPPSYKAAPVADTILPAHAAGIVGIVQLPETLPPVTLMLESHIPLMSPPEYCISQPLPDASTWKKSAAEQLPV